MAGTIHILIADDQLLFAENLKIMLETLTEDIRVVGIASDGLEAVRMAGELSPDIILMDVRMPNMDGVEATKIILTEKPSQKIVVMTTFHEEDYITATLHFGAAGYLLKNMKSDDLITALRAVNNGTVLLSPQVMERLLRRKDEAEADQAATDEEARRNQELYRSFSNREKEVLRLLAQGYGNRRIAQALFLSEPTVRNYISSIYTKLGCNDRMEVMGSAKKILAHLPRP